MGAGSFTDMLADVESAAGRPLLVTPATRPDIILGVGAAQASTDQKLQHNGCHADNGSFRLCPGHRTQSHLAQVFICCILPILQAAGGGPHPAGVLVTDAERLGKPTCILVPLHAFQVALHAANM